MKTAVCFLVATILVNVVMVKLSQAVDRRWSARARKLNAKARAALEKLR